MGFLAAYAHGPEPGPLAMARDAVLLDVLAERRTPPHVVRAHGWTRPTLSVGRVQRLGIEMLADAREAGVAVVRRPTGGGWLLHLPGDLSVSYLAAGPLRSGELRGAAATIAGGLSQALVRAGRGGRVQRPEGGVGTRSPVCFARIDREEVSDDGIKVAGVAIVLRRRAALAQTALPLVPAPDPVLEDFAERWDPQRRLAVERLSGLDPGPLSVDTARAVAAAVERPLREPPWEAEWEERSLASAGEFAEGGASSSRDGGGESL
mgnify:CR=1 FL=1